MRATIAERIERGRAEGDVPTNVDAAQLAGFVDIVMTGMSARARDGADYAELSATAEIALAAFPSSDLPDAKASRDTISSI